MASIVLAFAIGLFLGVILGVLCMALAAVNRGRTG